MCENKMANFMSTETLHTSQSTTRTASAPSHKLCPQLHLPTTSTPTSVLGLATLRSTRNFTTGSCSWQGKSPLPNSGLHQPHSMLQCTKEPWHMHRDESRQQTYE